MKAILLALGLFFSISACAQWKDEALTASYFTLLVADRAQTLGGIPMAQAGKTHEVNPLLGEIPTRGRVNVYFLGVAIVSAVGLNVMPEKYRFGTLLVLNAVEVIAVGHNAALGIHMSF